MISPETIDFLAWRAADTYYRHPPGSTVLKDACGQVRGYAVVDEKTVTIAIAGTKSVHDCRVDGDLLREHVSGGRVHRGFWSEYQSLRHTLAGLYLAHTEKVIRICGHSLGGALALYAAVDAAALNCRVELVTLGSPAACDARFREWCRRLKIKHVRIVHAHDLVPHLPVFGYCHVGRAIVLDEAGRTVGAARGLGQRARKLARILWAWIRLRPIEDHHVLYYLKPVDLYCEHLLKGGAP